MGVVDAEVTSVDLVVAVTRVEVGEGCDRRADPAYIDGVANVTGCAVLGVVDHELIFVRMAKEDSCNYVGGVAVDDLVEEISRIRKRIRSVPSCQNMAQYPDTLALRFRVLELRSEELEIATVIGIRGIYVVEEIASVPEIGIESDDSQLWVYAA